MLSLQPYPVGQAYHNCALFVRPLRPTEQTLTAEEQISRSWRNVRILRCESHPPSITCHGSPLPHRSILSTSGWKSKLFPTYPGSALQPQPLQPLQPLQSPDHSQAVASPLAFAYLFCLSCPALSCLFKRQLSLLQEAFPHFHKESLPLRLGQPSLRFLPLPQPHRAGESVSTCVSPHKMEDSLRAGPGSPRAPASPSAGPGSVQQQ